jgi:hypothetical protein
MILSKSNVFDFCRFFNDITFKHQKTAFNS